MTKPAAADLPDEVRRFMQTATATGFPPGARFGDPAASDYLQRAREQMRNRSRRTDAEPVETVLDEVTDGAVPVRVYVPARRAEPCPMLVFFHGGGWVLGDLEMHDATCRSVANDASAVVVNVDYRLAPEHPFPAPLDDAFEATAWAMRAAGTYGADPGVTLVGGTSSGANLAAAVALRWQQLGQQPPLAGALLLYPALDATMGSASYREKANGFPPTADQMRFFWDAYVQGATDRTDPLVSPANATDLTGFPPSVVITAEHDVLRDEGDAFAQRLGAGGRLLAHLRVSGQVHGFLMSFPTSTATKEARGVIARAFAVIASGRS